MSSDFFLSFILDLSVTIVGPLASLGILRMHMVMYITKMNTVSSTVVQFNQSMRNYLPECQDTEA